MDNEIIIASGNKGKIKEAQDILAEYKILPIKELGIDITSQEKHELIKKITSEEISEFMNRLVLDTVYFLEEEEHE